MPSFTTTAAFVLFSAGILYCNALLIQQAAHVELAPALYQENNLLENAQLAVLVGCLVIMALHAVRSDHRGGRLVSLAAVLLSFSLVVRESDLRPFDLPAWLTWFSDGPGRYVLLVPPWLVLLRAARRHLHAVRGTMRRLLLSPAGAALASSALLLTIGILFDKGFIRLAPSRYYEELCELNGYVFMLLAALASGRYLQRNKAPART